MAPPWQRGTVWLYRRALDGDRIRSCKRKKPSCRHGPHMRQDKEIDYTRITDWDIHALFSPRLNHHMVRRFGCFSVCRAHTGMRSRSNTALGTVGSTYLLKTGMLSPINAICLLANSDHIQRMSLKGYLSLLIVPHRQCCTARHGWGRLSVL